MTDRELLLLAAKAAGIPKKVVGATPGLYYLYREDDGVEGAYRAWNPLTDDGDALRLATTLSLCLSYWPRHTPPDVMVGYSISSDRGSNLTEEYGADPFKAMRRAILRAAAEIGKAMG